MGSGILLHGLGGHDHGDVLDALGGVGGVGVGVAFSGGGLEAVDLAQRALEPRAGRRDAVGLGLGGEFVLAVGAIDVDPADGVAGLLGGDDVVGGEAGLDRVVGAEGGDAGDDGLLAEGLGFVGGVGRRREGVGEGARRDRRRQSAGRR